MASVNARRCYGATIIWLPKTQLGLEELVPRVVPTVYAVGPGHTYANLHSVPWDQVGAGDTVQVYWKSTAYLDKIDISQSGTPTAPIVIEGISGPLGQHPVISAANAIENPQASYFTDQIASQGVFTLAPTGLEGYDYKTAWIVIDNLEITQALRDNRFTAAGGHKTYFNYGAAGVAMYHAEHIVISNCYIHDNENGLFGKSYGYEAGDLRDIEVRSNWILHNGVEGQDHYHNTYIEGDRKSTRLRPAGAGLAGR